MGPHRPGSQRSLSSGLDLLEALSTCKWVRRPWKTSDDLIQIADDLLGLWGKLFLRSQRRRR
jgi:hypothetical protein